MFWKFFEFLVRLVYFKRFRQADRISKAVKLAGEGDLEAALCELNSFEAKLHPSIKSIWGLSRGRILLAAGRLDEAESAFIFSAKADPSNAKAHLDLAVLAGRRFRFDDARERLEKLEADADEETQKEAQKILDLLEQVTNGKRAEEFEKRAREFATKTIGPNEEAAGLPANLKLLDDWIDKNIDDARKSADEIALLIGQSEVIKSGAHWKVCLSIEDSLVVFPDDTELNPFKIVALRISSGDATLAKLIES